MLNILSYVLVYYDIAEYTITYYDKVLGIKNKGSGLPWTTKGCRAIAPYWRWAIMLPTVGTLGRA